jgi:hypothetical protein
MSDEDECSEALMQVGQDLLERSNDLKILSISFIDSAA